MSATLSKEMQQHTYEIMNRVEDRHWWFVGRRAILESFSRKNSLSTQHSALSTKDFGCRLRNGRKSRNARQFR